ncbi:MAG: DinB family protein [Pirellulales bacterium]|nr:DinB family protein [Pirellulales bacterium]
MSPLTLAIDQLIAAREYTNMTIADLPDELWFRLPAAGVTHVAWQAGHLAVAEYGLVLKRIRGEQPEDEALISTAFRQAFGRGSQPQADPQANPTPAEIRAALQRVHVAALRLLPTLTDAELDESAGDPPHPLFITKLGAILWCARHEMVHTGQIALLRRMFGSAPRW